VNVASDARGGTGRPADIVAFGSRLDEESYAELEFRREDRFSGGIQSRIVTTLALLPPFFHFSGKLDNTIAVRQLYAQGTLDGWTLWGGARMYRGDDVYLLNFWPLDNQNTVGGGVGKAFTSSDTHVALHAGMQRLDNPYQFQEIPAPIPFGVGAQPITYLDRPRTIETLKVTQFIRNGEGKSYFHGSGLEKAGFKVIAYGELHQISAGARRDTNTNQDVSLPSDTGFLLGSQLTFFTGERDTFLSLVMRHARGLAAYDPLSTPDTFALDRTTDGASETRVVLSGNYEYGDFGVTGAGYLRWFRDAGPAKTTLAKYDEGIVAVRPQWYFAEHFGLALEGSYQARRYAMLAPNSTGALTPSLVRGAVVPYFSPSGRGTFKRPMIGLVYLISSRDAAARALYPAGDVFNQRHIEHYVGLNVEWWFNSSSYP
jgi:maltoporin